MFAMPPDNPLVDPPPTQTSVESYPQQIVSQQSSSQRLDLWSFESDVDFLHSEQEFLRFLHFCYSSAPYHPGTLGFGVAVPFDVEVGTTSPLSPLDCGSDYSTVGPLTPSSDYGVIGPVAKSYQYVEVPFDSIEGMNTTSGTPSETAEDVKEQPQEQQYGAAPAGAIGLGGGMHWFGNHDKLEVPSSPVLSFPTTEAGSCSPHTRHNELTEHASKGCANVASKKPAARKEKRKQPTTRVFPCLWPGCLASFARTNNLTVHHNGVHLKKRVHVCPFTGCPKALAGYSRKFDRDVHVRKRHPAEGPTNGLTNRGGRDRK